MLKILICLLLTASCKKEEIIELPEFADPPMCQVDSGGTDEHLKDPIFIEEEIFEAGTNGYHSYRIPAMITTKNGTLIAFCEGRKNGREDYGDIDLVARRSTDNGATWGDLFVIWDEGEGTCGNPTPVVDQATGTIWLFMSYNDEFFDGTNGMDEWGDRRVYTIKSDDDGITWTELTDRTNELVPLDYVWDAVGPGNGIQIGSGEFKGRMVIPAGNRIIYSDDHGQTWSYNRINPTESYENTVVELCNGNYMINSRSSAGKRRVSTSDDNGLTWSDWNTTGDLTESGCQASLIRFNTDYPPRLLFINPDTESTLRGNMTVKVSYDEGQNWPVKRLINSWPGGYSSMSVSTDGQVASLQEFAKVTLIPPSIRMSIYFRKFNLPWILNGTPEPLQ